MKRALLILFVLAVIPALAAADGSDCREAYCQQGDIVYEYWSEGQDGEGSCEQQRTTCEHGCVETDRSVECAPEPSDEPDDGDDTSEDGDGEEGSNTNQEPATTEQREGQNHTTNAFVTSDPDTLHLCGLHWNTTLAEQHPLCDEVSHQGITYTCAVGTDGWRWYTDKQGLPQMTDSLASWQNLTYGAAFHNDTELPLNLNETTSVACQNKTAVKARTTYTQPPTLEQAQCGPQQCAQQSSDGVNQCVDASTRSSSYICRAPDEGENATWVSVLEPLANHLLSLPELQGKEYLLNCGPAETVINKNDPQIAENAHGYCQLGLVDNNGEVYEIIAGIVFEDTSEDGFANGFKAELEKVHSNINDTLDEEWEDVTYFENDYASIKNITVGPSGNITVGYFTNEDSFGSGQATAAKIWDWFKRLFSSDEANTIKTTTAQQFFTSSSNDVSAAVEYAPGRCEESQQRKIVTDGNTTTCYTDFKWRRIIQQR